eukprot:4163379-Amphidinium_carterae.1
MQSGNEARMGEATLTKAQVSPVQSHELNDNCKVFSTGGALSSTTVFVAAWVAAMAVVQHHAELENVLRDYLPQQEHKWLLNKHWKRRHEASSPARTLVKTIPASIAALAEECPTGSNLKRS